MPLMKSSTFSSTSNTIRNLRPQPFMLLTLCLHSILLSFCTLKTCICIETLNKKRSHKHTTSNTRVDCFSHQRCSPHGYWFVLLALSFLVACCLFFGKVPAAFVIVFHACLSSSAFTLQRLCLCISKYHHPTFLCSSQVASFSLSTRSLTIPLQLQ